MILKKALQAASAGLILAGAIAAPTFASAATPVTIDAPASVMPSVTTSVKVRLPDGVAAVDGRVLLDATAADLVGVVASGGHALSPTQTADGFAFGVYGMKTSGTNNDLNLVLMPHVAGQLELRVVIDTAANAAGRRVNLSNQIASSRLQVGHGTGLIPAAATAVRGGPRLAPQALRGLFGRNMISADDLDAARGAWYGNRGAAAACGTNSHLDGDANGDGCVDIVDLQLIAASQGARVSTTASGMPARAVSPSGSSSAASPSVNAAAASSVTYTVTSTADAADASPGDGVCADSQGRCTLRAAITESNQHSGTNHVNFNLPGTAPVTIQLGSSTMSLVGSSSSSVVIDGYTQPGSQPNTAQYGFNGIPGVFVRGNGYSSTKYIFYVARAGNTIRGIAMGNAYRGVFLDTPNATGNTIAGDWFGFNANGSNSATMHAAVWLNNGANHNSIGTSSLADRNVAGNQDKAYYLYGAGTDSNTFQNNVACISPNGATAMCSTGFDVDFGPKSNLIGGMGPNQLNVVGPTLLNGIELSHGWDPNTNHINTPQYQINYNQIVGNWVGFRVDGNYDPNFVSAQYHPSADNGQALHAYDGSNYNTFDSNYVGAAYDGMTFAQSDSTGDIARNNIIGVSPLGQAAPLARYGIYVTGNTRGHVIEGNVIRHTASYGIALIDPNVLQVLISRNIVTDSNAAAIYEAPDPSDPSTGADNLLAPPVITAAGPGTVSGSGIAGAIVEVFQASKPAGQSGLPIAYLGSATVAGDGTWTLSVALQQGNVVTATQHVASGNSSVLGTNVSVGAPPPPPAASFTYQQQTNSLTVDFTDTSSGGPKAWSWDFGDGSSTSQTQNPSHTYPQSGDYTVTLIAANEGGSNAASQTVTVAPLTTGTTIATDSFTRTVSGWGSADAGGPYTLDGNAAHFNVASGVGQMTLPKAAANRGATLTQVSATDLDAVVRVASDKVAAGASIIVYLPVRQNGSGTNAYRPKLILNTNGTVSVGAGVLVNGVESAVAPAVVVPGLTQTANGFTWLRAKVTGTNPTTIKVKAWADGTTEPAGWQFSATNSAASLQGPGAVGLRTYANSGITNAPLVISFDDLSVTAVAPPPPPTGIAEDAFDREQSATWGSADNGGTYTLQGTAANYNVHNGTGQMTLGANVTRSALLNAVSATDVDVTFRVALDKVVAGAPCYVYAVARRIGNSEYRPRIVLNPNGSITVGASRVVNGTEASLGTGVLTGISQASGLYIWVRAQVTGTTPTTINVKAWADGTSEPQSWQFTATDSNATLQAPGSVGLRAYLSSGATMAPLTLSFDDYSVVAPAP